MRTIITLAFLLFCAQAQAQEPVLPKVGGVQVYGWAQVACADRDCEAPSMFRLRADINSGEPISGFIEADLTNGFEGNWLRQAFVSFSVDESTKLHIGRLFTAAPRATPPPFLLPTAQYMRYPFSIYGWGAQVSFTEGGLDVLVDVTGNTTSSFGDADQFDRLVTSGRVTYDISPVLEVGGTYQVSSDFQRFAVEATIRPAEGHLLNGAVYTTETFDGGFVYYSFQVREDLELHSRLDYQASAVNELLQTLGVRWSFAERFELTLDHEFARGESFVRLQSRF